MARGKAVSVYLDARALTVLEGEIISRGKREGKTLITPKGLTVPRMVAACVNYVIDKGKLESLCPDHPSRSDATGFVWIAK
jgi:hypothetical protein